MSNISETIIKLIDSGRPVLDIAKLFGGLDKLFEITKKYPYLQAIINTKLGGDLHCSAENEDGDMIPFSLNFIITELEQVELDEDFSHYNASVNVIIPELTDNKDMQILSSWLEDYLSDMGAEVGSFNDSKLNKKRIWIYVETINGKPFKPLAQMSVSDSEVLEIIPNEYKES
jgi:hypothetical protein